MGKTETKDARHFKKLASSIFRLQSPTSTPHQSIQWIKILPQSQSKKYCHSRRNEFYFEKDSHPGAFDIYIYIYIYFTLLFLLLSIRKSLFLIATWLLNGCIIMEFFFKVYERKRNKRYLLIYYGNFLLIYTYIYMYVCVCACVCVCVHMCVHSQHELVVFYFATNQLCDNVFTDCGKKQRKYYE